MRHPVPVGPRCSLVLESQSARLLFCCLALPVFMSQLIASDILWSDPSTRLGQVLNNQRYVGTRFGPDVTEVCASRLPVSLLVQLSRLQLLHSLSLHRPHE
jgi:hypothetical protein